MRTFWTAVKWPTCFSLVISPSLLLSSLILFYFPTGHLSFSLSSSDSALMPTSCAIIVATVTADRCLVPLLQWGNTGQEVESTCTHFCTNTPHYDSCTMLGCECLSVMQSTLGKFFTQTHTHTFLVPTSDDRGCVAVPSVTGSPSPQMTNRYNQLSRDPSHCCHIHYSWTNTYIKQSGATGHYTTPTQSHLFT